MSKRRPNPRLVKIHHSYTVEEIAKLFAVHRNTVREWIKRGLPTIDRQRPLLVLGHELRAYLEAKRGKNKRPCQPGEIYCLRCRTPKAPAGGMVDYRQRNAKVGMLEGICPTCDLIIHKCVSVAKLGLVQAELDVRITPAP